MIAGMCVSIIDFMISRLEDHKQVEFEKEIINLFNLIVENRHDFTNKVDDFTIEE